MDEKTHKAIDRIQSMEQGLAESQAERAIGLAAVALHQQGQPVTTQALVEALLTQAQSQAPGQLKRLQHEAAARLLGWQTAKPD